MTYEDAELIAIGKLATQLHYEMKGERIRFPELPCPEAMQQAMSTAKGADEAVAALRG